MNILTRALSFLELHQGACSVERASQFGEAFQLLEQAGKVKIKVSGTAGFIDVYSPDFTPKFNGGEK